MKADQTSRIVAGEAWRADVTCDERPPMGSMLYITRTPGGGGGDTAFVSAIAAFEALSPALQGFLEGLSATHDGGPSPTQARTAPRRRPAAGRSRPILWSSATLQADARSST